MKAQAVLLSLAPLLACAAPADLDNGFRLNTTTIPGIVIEHMNVGRSSEVLGSNSLSTRAIGPQWEIRYGTDSAACDTIPYTSVKGNAPSDCALFDQFDEQPGFIHFNNPQNAAGDSVWELKLFMEGDECPVIGHAITCDSAIDICVRFEGSRPLSYLLTETVGGVRQCDPL